MPTLDFETDQFLTLLTDALRAGPGSPSWHQAVGKLKLQGLDGSDEYRMLLETRENLESGKPYREVRPGPEFTRKILSAIDEEPEQGRVNAMPMSTIVAIAAALVGLIAVIVIGYLLLVNGQAQRATLADLQNQPFTHEALAAPLQDAVPAGWNAIGPVPLIFNKELRPSEKAGTEYQGAAMVTSVPLPADQAAAMELTFHLGHVTEGVIAQVFVTDDSHFSDDRATSPHELVWTLQPVSTGKGQLVLRPQVVLPDGTFAGTGDDLAKGRDSLAVRLMINGDFVVVDSDSKRLYAGPHHLAPDKPRYFGVRFLRRGNVKPAEIIGVEAVRIMK